MTYTITEESDYHLLSVGDRQIARMYHSSFTGNWCGWNPQLSIGEMMFAPTRESLAEGLVEQDARAFAATADDAPDGRSETR